MVGTGAVVAGCFVGAAAGLTICSGLDSVAIGEATVGAGLGRGVPVGIGCEVAVGRVVGVTTSAGPGALEQASDAGKPVRINIQARNFPGINGGLRT